MEQVLNALAFAVLLTSLWVLRFRGWERPGTALVYFIFFAALELAVAHLFLPPGAFGSGLGILCFALTVPVLVAAFLIWRHERREDRTG